MCNLYCHGCKKPLSLCSGHEEIYLWVPKEDLFVHEQVILNREDLWGGLDDFDDFDDWPSDLLEVDLDDLLEVDLASPSVEGEDEDYSEFNDFLK